MAAIKPRLAAAVTAAAVAAAALALAASLRHRQEQEVARLSRAQAVGLRQLLSMALTYRSDSVARMARRWAGSEQPSREQWESEARHYLRDFRTLEALAWVDAGGSERWAVARSGTAATRDARHRSPEAQEALAAAGASGRPAVSRTVPLAGGEAAAADTGFLVAAPVAAGEGYLVASFRAGSFFGHSIPEAAVPGFAIRVLEGSREVFHRGSPLAAGAGGAAGEPLAAFGPTWRVEVAASDDAERDATSPAPLIALLLGLGLAGGAGWGTHATLVARQRARRLEEEIEQRRTAEADRDRFFELSLDLLCVAGLDGRFRRLNRAWTEVLGWPIEELLARPFFDFLHPEDQGSTVAALERLGKGEPVIRFENRYRCRDGAYRLFEWTCPAPPAGTSVLYAVARDVTEVQAREQRLRRLSRAMEHAVEGIAEIDPAGRIAAPNRSFAELFGDAPEALERRHWSELVQADDVAAARAAADAAARGEKGEAEVRTAAARERYLALAFVRADGLDGSGALYLFAQDVTGARRGRERRVRELEQTNRLAELLHASRSEEEVYEIAGRIAASLLPHYRGTVAITSASGVLVEVRSRWGDPDRGDRADVFAPDDCWAIRRGRLHASDRDESLRCRHAAADRDHLCAPLVASGEMLGVLTLAPAEPGGTLTDEVRQLAITVAETVALSVANIRLRETLRRQSIRDPLTGLFNRRYLQEALESEVRRATRKQGSIAVLMIDVDYFKQFNDTHGHAAGDAVLRAVGRFLAESVRGGDVACRWGGEEFVVMMPEAEIESAAARAEELRQAIEELGATYAGGALGGITVSIGIAAFPRHGSGEEVLQAADEALYRAKSEGRNRVAA